jgi:hypothetical protein
MTEETSTPTTEAADVPSPPSGVADAIAQLRAETEESPAETPAEKEEAAEEAEATEPPAPAEEAEAPAEEEVEEVEEEEKEDEPSDSEPFKIALPGREAGDPDEEIELDGLTKAQRDAFIRLRKGYLRREHLHRELASVQRDRADLLEIDRELADSPHTFLLEKVKNPALVTDIALTHLARMIEDDESGYQGVIDRLAELEEDADKRAELLGKQKAKKQEAAAADGPLDGLVSEDPEVERVLQYLRQDIPTTTTKERARVYMEDALVELHQYMIENDLDRLTEADIETALAELPTPFLPGKAKGAKSSKSTGSNGSTAPVPPKAAPARTAPSDTGKRLATASVRRREAATVPAGGAAPSAAPTPMPKGGGVKEALAALRNNTG